MSVAVVFETHSTSVDNERGIATGWNEGELSPTGREQARELGERRREDGIAVVFTSDLRAARSRPPSLRSRARRSRSCRTHGCASATTAR